MLGATNPQVLNRLGNSSSLEERIEISNGLPSTEPRDYIYALLSLASDVDELRMRPDYNKSVAQVFTEAAQVLLEKLQALRILSWRQRIIGELVSKNKLADLPS
jgi:hypothetical protein